MTFSGNSDDRPPSGMMSIKRTGDHREEAPDGEVGEGVCLETTRGDVHCLLHPASEPTQAAVLMAVGARGGFGGPADGLYPQLAEELAGDGIATLRFCYRRANQLDECVLDALASVSYLSSLGCRRIGVVGHSFGGAVALSAARYSRLIAAAVTLASQTYGAEDVVLLTPRPLLIVHGEEDARLPVDNAHQIYDWAFEPKEKVIYPGAGHGLRERREELLGLLRRWLPEKLLRPDR